MNCGRGRRGLELATSGKMVAFLRKNECIDLPCMNLAMT